MVKLQLAKLQIVSEMGKKIGLDDNPHELTNDEMPVGDVGSHRLRLWY